MALFWGWERLLRRVAERRPGVEVLRYGKRDWTLTYERERWKGIVSFAENYSRFEARVRNSNPSLSLRTQGMDSGLARFLGAEDILIGEPGFDARYLITASPAKFAKRFLDTPIRAAIDRLHDLAGALVVDLCGNRVHLQVSRRLEREIDGFLAEGETIIEAAATEGSGAEIEFKETKVRRAGICQVCESPMNERVVECAKCRTRHHEDCWTYYGSCSTFGCGGKDFVRD